MELNTSGNVFAMDEFSDMQKTEIGYGTPKQCWNLGMRRPTSEILVYEPHPSQEGSLHLIRCLYTFLTPKRGIRRGLDVLLRVREEMCHI
jgi:hypothetical protein